jgi:hypothetical protein
MKHTNKMVNIESNPLNGSSFVNDLRNKYMENQTAVEWLHEEYMRILKDNDISVLQAFEILDKYNQAKEMEKEQRIMAYNAGHADGLCNHINDADNYINEQNYLKGENID